MSFIGKNIRYLRKEKKLSQAKLGEQVGKSESTIQMWETGFRSPTMGTVQKLSEIFEISINDLMNTDLQNTIIDESMYSQLHMSFKKLPLYGDLCCGDGMFNDDNILEYIAIPIDGLNPNLVYFCQRSKGDSMQGAGIIEGDILVFEKTNVIDDNAIGTFCVDENIATCKKIKKGKDFIQLLPMNPHYDPIIITLDNYNFRVVGKLKKVIRNID